MAIDESGSIPPNEFPIMNSSIHELVDAYDKISSGSYYSAVGFDTSAEVISMPTTDISEFKKKISENQQSGGSTDMGVGLNKCFELIRNASGSRVILLYSDGGDSGQGLQASMEIKNTTDIVIATVGIGSSADEQELKGIATSENLYTDVNDFESLIDNTQVISESICVPETIIPSVSVAVPSLLAVGAGSFIVASFCGGSQSPPRKPGLPTKRAL